MKEHNPFEGVLFKLHQSQLPKAVLNLLGQGAPSAMAPRGVDLHQPWGFCLPAELEPHHALQGSKAELERVGIGLLRLFKSAWQHPVAQIFQHRFQSGQVHHLERAGGHPRVLFR